MTKYVKIAIFDNEIEARLVESIVSERNIPYILRSYHDTAYDGLFQTQKGWGYISVPEAFEEEVTEIVSHVREQADGSE